jgi:hypothetical protein
MISGVATHEPSHRPADRAFVAELLQRFSQELVRSRLMRSAGFNLLMDSSIGDVPQEKTQELLDFVFAPRDEPDHQITRFRRPDVLIPQIAGSIGTMYQ